MHRIKKVEYLDGYRLRLRFNNDEVKIIDLSDELKNAKNKFIDLKDIHYFKMVECDGISIIWPNEIDFCPDWLYKNSQLESKPMARKKSVKPKSSSRKPVRRKTAHKCR